MATPENVVLSWQGVFNAVEAPTRIPVPARHGGEPISPQPEKLPKSPPRKTLPGRLRRALFFAATRIAPSAVLLGGGVLAVQHHFQKRESLDVLGITRDIKGIPSTAKENIDTLIKLSGLNIDPEPKITPDNPDSAIVQAHPLAPEIIPNTFDPNSDKAQKIEVGSGGNAQPAKLEKISEILAQRPPLIENPTNGMPAPNLQVFVPFNPENARSAKIEKIFNKDASERLDYQFFNTHILISGENVPFYIPLIEGAESVKARKSITAFGISSIYFTYRLKDGQLINGEISFWDNNYIPSANLNDIPGYNPNELTTGTLVNASPTKEFNLLQTSLVDLFTVSGSTKISISFGKVGSDRGFKIDPSWVTENGKLLYPSPEVTAAQ